MMRWLRWGMLGLVGLIAIAGGALALYSWRIAHDVAAVEQKIVRPLPTSVAVAVATATNPPRATSAPGVPTLPPLPTSPPAPTPTVVVPPNTGQILKDGVRTAVNDSDGHEAVWEGKRYIHILLLGLDRRDNEPARSDTMIIATVDLWSGLATMLSIPRDLLVEIPGYGEDRVNAAFAYGETDHPDDPVAGAALAVETVAKQFKVPIEHYIEINFSGFRGVVDAVGGVDISVATEIDDADYPTDDYGYKHVHFDPGCYHMNGEQALEYARTRHASSDNERRDRQMQVMQAVLNRAADVNAARRLPDVIKSLGDSVQTSIPWEGQLSLARMSRRINAAGVNRYSIAPPMVRGIITRYGASVYVGDWPAISALTVEATDPKRPIRQDRLTPQNEGSSANDDPNAPAPAAPPGCGAR